MTEYLVRLPTQGTWHIAAPTAVEDDTEKCSTCDSAGHTMGRTCEDCVGTGRVKGEGRTIRLCWAERDGSILVFDWQEPEVRRLPGEE